MKKIKIILVFLFISCFAIAQHSAYKPTGEKYRRMVDAKIKAVYSGDPSFDSLYEKYVKEVFVGKSVDFISNNDFEEQRTNIDYTFILPLELTVTYENSGQQMMTISGPPRNERVEKSFMLVYYPGTKKKILKKDLNLSNFISIVNFDPSLPQDYLTASQYRLKNMVQELYQTIEILEKTGENKFFLKPSKYLKEVYNSKSNRIKDKELIVCADAISISERDFKKVYPYKFRILDKEAYKKEIAQYKDGNCYLVFSSIVEVFVVDNKTGEVILETGFMPEIRKLIKNPRSVFQLDDKQISEIVKMTK